jgi:peroxiredoxin Q/BCP
MRIQLACALALLTMTATNLIAADLKVGDNCPAFTMQGSDGKTYTLNDFKGNRAFVIAWFPKAFTGGCTTECKSMRDSSNQLKGLDVAYFTASVDTPEKNKEFAESLSLNFPILSDPSKEAATALGVLGPKGFAQRWTFYVDKDGKIVEIDKQVSTKTHGEDIAAKLKSLGLAAK